MVYATQMVIARVGKYGPVSYLNGVNICVTTYWKKARDLSINHPPKSLYCMAEVHGNRTHPGDFSSPTPVLKTGAPTSDACTSMYGCNTEKVEREAGIIAYRPTASP